MDNIRFEKVGDVNSVYPYLGVFTGDDINPFMEISISDQRELVFKFYAHQSEIFLTSANWHRIYITAEAFLPSALKNEGDFNAYY